ncbi:MAG: hypothetical protein IT328_21140 [Caldilineaceae bacterium]|nr:hypothetical protein [Caldilineaceae bacterium]
MKRKLLIVVSLVALTLLVFVACQPVTAPGAPAENVPVALEAAEEGHSHAEGEDHSHDEGMAADELQLMDNLGNHHHAISSENEEAQAWFDQGLTLDYAFNHELAIASYQKALEHDPECAMCYWGIAWSLGPNINLPMDDALVPDAWAALQRAQELAPNAPAQDQAYIEALAARYAPEAVADRAPLDLAFADAMRAVAAAYPDDLDAATIFAEALMDTMPWDYWTPEGEPREATVELLATLESVLERNPDHPGANHYYIHATEASTNPDRAIPSAERLETLVPGAGHLVHMPAHTYWRVGRYYDAFRINLTAHDADMHTVGGTPDKGTFYSLAYYPHNIHFLFAAAQMLGNSEDAIQAARDLVGSLPDDIYRAIPMFEDFRPMYYYSLVRFGKWDEILAEPAPADDLRLSTGMWNYAQGMARLRTGDTAGAEQALAEVQAYAAMPELAEQGLASFATAQQILQISSGILAGEIAAAQGDYETAVAELEASVAIQDSLPYIEPPAWFYPVRQTLGAVLLEAGRAEDAEAVYRKDLEQYRANGWSLFGLMTALEAQGKNDEAATVQAEFEAAWQYADVELTASRF